MNAKTRKKVPPLPLSSSSRIMSQHIGILPSPATGLLPTPGLLTTSHSYKHPSHIVSRHLHGIQSDCMIDSMSISSRINMHSANPFFMHGLPAHIPNIDITRILISSHIYNELKNTIHRVDTSTDNVGQYFLDYNTMILQTLTMLGYSILCPSERTIQSIHTYVPLLHSHIQSTIQTDPKSVIYSLLKPIIMEWTSLSRLWNDRIKSTGANTELILTGGSALWFYTLNSLQAKTYDYDYKILPPDGQQSFEFPYMSYKLWIIYAHLLTTLLNIVVPILIERLNRKYNGAHNIIATDFKVSIIAAHKSYPSMEIDPLQILSNKDTQYGGIQSFMNLLTVSYATSVQRERCIDMIFCDTAYMKNPSYRFILKNISNDDKILLSSSLERPCGILIPSFEFIINDMKKIIIACSAIHPDNDDTQINLRNPCGITKDIRRNLLHKYIQKAGNMNKNIQLLLYISKTVNNDAGINLKNVLKIVRDTIIQYTTDLKDISVYNITNKKKIIISNTPINTNNDSISDYLSILNNTQSTTESEESNSIFCNAVNCNSMSNINNKRSNWSRITNCCKRPIYRGGKRTRRTRKVSTNGGGGDSNEFSIALLNMIHAIKTRHISSNKQPELTDILTKEYGVIL